MKNLRQRMIMKLMDFGLYVLSCGPKGQEEREMERQLIAEWRKAKSSMI